LEKNNIQQETYHVPRVLLYVRSEDTSEILLVFLELAKKHYSAHFDKTNAEKEEDASMGIIEGSLYGRRLQHWFKAAVGLQTLQWTRSTNVWSESLNFNNLKSNKEGPCNWWTSTIVYC